MTCRTCRSSAAWNIA